VYNTVAVELAGKPAVALVHHGFMIDAGSALSGQGISGLRIISETIPCESSVMDQVEAGVARIMDDIIAGLTKPLSEEERAPRAKEIEKPPRVVFKGDLKEVTQFFYRRGWSDGLPIVPPTEEEVAEMLTGTDLPPDHVVTKIIPRMGKATVEKIAINAVMAGALPTSMPLLIAAAQAIMDPRGRFGIWEVSTGSWAPCLMVNGPIRRDLNLNVSTGMLSPGNVANATIGRAIGLMVKNIGGARAGIEDMGVMGNPMKYSMVIAENEEESPWEPLHVQQGFKKEDSAVTVFFPNTNYQMMAYGSDDRGILSTIIHNLGPGRRDGNTCVLLIPEHAKILADSGWTKKDITSFITRNAHVTYSHHPNYWGSFVTEDTKLAPLHPYDPILLIPSPDRIRIVVAGGPGNFVALVRGSAGDYKGSGSTSEWAEFVPWKVELPAKWDQLVSKYKNLTAKHVRY
jgi:hypothetical protein